jgi:hypothetical protein
MLKALRGSLLALAFAGLALPSAYAQVTGGQRAFEFLRLPQSARASALGGINVTAPGNDVAMAAQNPALMRPALHNDLALTYNSYYAGISIANMQYGYHSEKWNTSLFGGIQYINYGNFTQTDAAGNEIGSFRAADFAVTLGAGRSYGERWRYGADIKLASSRYADRSAAAVLTDVGVLYVDTAKGITAGAVAKNIGFMAKKYTTSNAAEPLPFDLQIGFSKRLAHVPLRFTATAHHLYEWDIRYNNPADVDRSNLFGTTDSSVDKKSYFADKLFRHLIFGADVLLGKRITATVAYNHLRRGELGLKERQALSGFSFGVTAHLDRFQVQYARSYYHLAGATNEIGFNVRLSKTVGIGKATERLRWNKVYEDWRN